MRDRARKRFLIAFTIMWVVFVSIISLAMIIDMLL
jgi:hypothetical protein